MLEKTKRLITLLVIMFLRTNSSMMESGLTYRKIFSCKFLKTCLRASTKAVVITEIKLKQNKRKTMFCFSEIVLFQFCFSVFTCETKR